MKATKLNPQPLPLAGHHLQPPCKRPHNLSFSLRPDAVAAAVPPLVVVGSANADIFLEIPRLPLKGETISAKSSQSLPGGKGANQAACASKLDHPTYFIGQVGADGNGRLIADALEGGGVRIDRLKAVPDAPTGHAVVMLQADGQNSIIIVGGANMVAWPGRLANADLDLVRRAGVVLLQREIPDSVNIQVAKVSSFYLFTSI